MVLWGFLLFFYSCSFTFFPRLDLKDHVRNIKCCDRHVPSHANVLAWIFMALSWTQFDQCAVKLFWHWVTCIYYANEYPLKKWPSRLVFLKTILLIEEKPLAALSEGQLYWMVSSCGEHTHLYYSITASKHLWCDICYF